MVRLSEPDIRSDHVHWCDDFATWIQDINRWQGRHDAILAELRRLYAVVVFLKSAARGHAETIAGYTSVCDRHDETIAHGADPGSCDAMMLVHNQVGARHAHIEGDHERIKKHHEMMIARLRELLDSVGVGGKDKETWSTTE